MLGWYNVVVTVKGIDMAGIQCEVCGRSFRSDLDLARHKVLKDLPTPGKPGGAHILHLEKIMRQPYESFGHGSDKRIAIALKNYYSSSR